MATIMSNCSLIVDEAIIFDTCSRFLKQNIFNKQSNVQYHLVCGSQTLCKVTVAPFLTFQYFEVNFHIVNMHIRENTKNSLTLSANNNIINDDTYKKLLENCFAVLLKKSEIHRKSDPLYETF